MRSAASSAPSRFQPRLKTDVFPALALARLLRERADVQARIERLRAGKADIPAEQYERELEALIVELARLERQIRSRGK